MTQIQPAKPAMPQQPPLDLDDEERQFLTEYLMREVVEQLLAVVARDKHAAGPLGKPGIAQAPAVAYDTSKPKARARASMCAK